MSAEEVRPVTVVACVKRRGQGSPSCGGRGSEALLTRLRVALEARGLGDVAIEEVQCLGRCTIGPNMRLKGGAFFTGVTDSDLDALCHAVEAARAGRSEAASRDAVPPAARGE